MAVKPWKNLKKLSGYSEMIFNLLLMRLTSD